MPRLAIQDENWTLSDFAEMEMNAPRDERWELIGGRIWRMMTGGTAAHNEIVLNLATAIHAALRGGGLPCRVYTENVKVVNAAAGLSAFPDLFVRCGERQPDQSEFDDPLVIVEVLSPSTRGKDTTVKARAYRAIPTLSHLLLVDQERMSVTVHQRNGGVWTTTDLASPDDRLVIGELGFATTLAAVYDGVVGL